MAALSSNAPLFPGMEPIVDCLRGIAREVENDTDSGSDSSTKEECIAMGKPPQRISMTVENDPYCLEDYYQMVADAHADGEAEGYDFAADLPTKEEWIAGFDEPQFIDGPVELNLETCKKCLVEYKAMTDLYNLACKHYQDTREGEAYEFSLEKAMFQFTTGVEYTFTITAKNVGKGDIETIEAVALYIRGVKMEILRCEVVKPKI